MTASSTLITPSGLWAGKIYSGGWRNGGLGKHPVVDKANGELLGEVGFASAEDVAAAAAMGAKAQPAWSEMPSPLRGDILRKFAELLLQHHKEISDWTVRETGSTRLKSGWEAQMCSRIVLEGAALTSHHSGLQLATAVQGRESFARRVPIGVVGVITPWNSPMTLACRALAPALAMGNAVILKPDPQTPVSGGVLLAAIADAAGLPNGLLHVLPGAIETGEALVKERLIRMVSFTGSTRAGRRVGALAGEHVKRVSLELGGNNAYIITEDADLDLAAGAGAWGSFFHQGQICTTIGRHIVHQSVAGDYVRRLSERAKKLTVGDPNKGDFDLGPIINERQARNVERIVKDTIAQGATLVQGGGRDGLFFQPTVISGLKPGMPAFEEEIFGPVAAIATFGTDEEAIDLANRTDYGLVSSVVSRDYTRAKRIASRLHAGMVHINDQTVVHEVYGPVGGIGCSGNGWNYGTSVNADQFTEWQWTTIRSDLPSYAF